MKKAKDPVCGMTVDVAKAKKKNLTAKKGNKTYYFCSEDCKDKFTSEKPKIPLDIILSVVIILLAIIVIVKGYMLPFMGIVFLILASLKLIDIKGFSQMFVQYDLIAKRSKAYSYVYPFIELALGLAFLFQFQVFTAAIVTVVVMSIGAIGIGKNLLSKNRIQCACLGAKIKVPLTRFTLVEDIVMAVMGAMIIFL